MPTPTPDHILLPPTAMPQASKFPRAYRLPCPWSPPPSLPSAQRSNASGFAVVAPSAVLASPMQCFGWRQAQVRHVLQDGTGEASACPNRARYAAAMRRSKSECTQFPGNLAIVTCKNEGEEEESYFVGGKEKNKGKKGPKSNSAAAAHSSSSNVNLPFAVITTLLSMSISLLSSQADMPLMVE